MSATPPPPEAAATADTAAAAAAAAAAGGDWRRSVLQSYRNQEVREIASVLAALEPGATASSKLMLAMRFEDTIFKSASSLADYRKKLTKRLKKLQKNYVPPTKEATSNSANDTEVLLLELRRKYGEALRYITKNAGAAIKDVEERSGAERSKQLQQHTDSAIQWAKELGIWDEAPESAASTAAKATEAQLQKLQQHLERRVDNIRTYVVKHADPDQFLQETLERKDKELEPRANKMMGINLTKRIEQVQQSSVVASSQGSSGQKPDEADATAAAAAAAASSFDPVKVLQESLEKAQTAVPPPTRNNSNDVPAALMHLEKVRAASTALMAYFCIPDRQQTAPRNTLPKIFTAASEGMEFARQVTLKLPKPTTDKASLSDAWTKVLELPLVVDPSPPTLDSESPSSPAPPAKRPRLSQPLATKSRVLLTPNRKTPSNLIPALRRKRALLVRPPHGSRGSHLILEFDTAFTMTIYFSPLLVTLRAMEQQASDASGSSTTTNGANKSTTTTRPTTTTTQLSTKGCAPWTPLYHGLTNRTDLSVWGVTDGSYASMGRVVEERLRDASMQATHVLRRCFRNHVKDKVMEFEVEILEASALLEFLQIARRTYMPNWQDED
jgi:hypothetical protein